MTPDQEVESILMGPRTCWAPGGAAQCGGMQHLPSWPWPFQKPDVRSAYKLNSGPNGSVIDCPVCKPLYLKQLYRK